MKPGQVIDLTTNDAQEEAILSRAEATITPVVIRMNNLRTRVNGTSGVAHGYPLPGVAEELRSFLKRLSR